MPETQRMSFCWIESVAQAFCRAASTPKSPQLGHQSGLTSDLKSVALSCLSSGWGVRIGTWNSWVVALAIEDLPDLVDRVFGVDGLSVVGEQLVLDLDAGLHADEPAELAGEVELDGHRLLGALERLRHVGHGERRQVAD